MERGLAFLGTLGNNAPFVGLLGTVIGMVDAFDELGRPESLAAAGSLAPQGDDGQHRRGAGGDRGGHCSSRSRPSPRTTTSSAGSRS